MKKGVLDVQGKAIEGGLKGVGIGGIDNIRVGRVIEFDIEADDFAKARPLASKLCDELLANPVIESYEIREQ